MTDSNEAPEWPREVWMRELRDYHNGRGEVVLSEFATVPRFEGCPDTDCEFQRYVDGDIYDSAEKYWKTRLTAAEDRVAELEAFVQCVRDVTHHPVELVAIARTLIKDTTP